MRAYYAHMLRGCCSGRSTATPGNTATRVVAVLLFLGAALAATAAYAQPLPRVSVLSVEGPSALVERAGDATEDIASALDNALPDQDGLDLGVIIVAASQDSPRTFTFSDERERASKVRSAADLVLASSRGLTDDTIARDLADVLARLEELYPGGYTLDHRRLDARTGPLTLEASAPPPASDEAPDILDRDDVVPPGGKAFLFGALPAMLLMAIVLGVVGLLLRRRFQQMELPGRQDPGREVGPAPPQEPLPSGDGVATVSPPRLTLGRDTGSPRSGRRSPSRSKAKRRSSSRRSLLGPGGLVLLVSLGASIQAQPSCPPTEVVDVSGSATAARADAVRIATALLADSPEIELVLFGDSTRSVGLYASPEAVEAALRDAGSDETTSMASVFYYLAADAERKQAAGCEPRYTLVSDWIEDTQGADAAILTELGDNRQVQSTDTRAPASSAGDAGPARHTALIGLAGLVTLLLGGAFSWWVAMRRYRVREIGVRAGVREERLPERGEPLRILGPDPDALVLLRRATGGMTVNLQREKRGKLVLMVEPVEADQPSPEPDPSTPHRRSLLSS